MDLRPFHLAFRVDDLDAARAFYGGLLGCSEGRSSDHWIDFDMWGHQIVAHLVESSKTVRAEPVEALSFPSNKRLPACGSRSGQASTSSRRTEKRSENTRATNPVDGHDVPVPHFGVVLPMADWRALADRLEAADVAFVIPPTIRFRDRPGEQATMFLRDPAGNALEFKAFADESQLFAT